MQLIDSPNCFLIFISGRTYVIIPYLTISDKVRSVNSFFTYCVKWKYVDDRGRLIVVCVLGFSYRASLCQKQSKVNCYYLLYLVV